MQRAWLLPLAVVVVTTAIIVSSRPPAAGDRPVAMPSASGSRAGAESLLDLDAYVDPDFGFMLGVPAGWTAVPVPESDAELAMFEPGYAVGFQSPREHATDIFTDYLMIEILPGDESGLFETDGSRRVETRVAGRRAWRDALTLPADTNDAANVDLVVRQAVMSGLGYTIGFYAVGEPERLGILEDAFEAMLRTFRLPRRPFDVS